jgi:hypothetical protein
MVGVLADTTGVLAGTTGLPLGVTVACGCGGPETQNITMKPVLWSGTGACPEKEGQVHFTVTGKWCEFEVKNENKAEKVTVLAKAFNFPGGEPGCKELGVECVGYKGSRATECKTNVTLAAKGGTCYTRVEYEKKPGITVKVKTFVTTESENNAPGQAEGKLLVE